MSRQTFLEGARSYAARNPGDSRHQALLTAVQSTASAAGMTGELTAAIARAMTPAFIERLADALTAHRARAAATSTRTTAPLNLAAARARTAAERAAMPPQRSPETSARPVSLANLRRPAQPPTAPRDATRVVASDGTWRWSAVDLDVPGNDTWAPLLSGLVAAGPFQSLHLTAALLDNRNGEASFQHDGNGAEWVQVVVDRRLHFGLAQRVIAHELAHVADEIARLDLVASLDSWRTTFAHPHRSAQAEAFASEAEEWVNRYTRAADLIAAARRHQARRGRH